MGLGWGTSCPYELSRNCGDLWGCDLGLMVFVKLYGIVVRDLWGTSCPYELYMTFLDLWDCSIASMGSFGRLRGPIVLQFYIYRVVLDLCDCRWAALVIYADLWCCSFTPIGYIWTYGIAVWHWRGAIGYCAVCCRGTCMCACIQTYRQTVHTCIHTYIA